MWTNLTVILADTQSIAINARAAYTPKRHPQQDIIIARTLTSPWHAAKSSTNSSIWSTNRWAITLARRLCHVKMLSVTLVTLDLQVTKVFGHCRVIKQPLMGIKASEVFYAPTNFDQNWALPDLTKSIVAMTRQDSDLEAFSHNPTDGSFTALLTRATVCANCPNLRFLSY